MIQQLLKLKRGKWAIVLVSIAVVAVIYSIADGRYDTLPGAAILLVVAAILVATGIRVIKNPPAPPVQEDDFLVDGQLPHVANTPVILSQGEDAVYCSKATRVETKNRIVGKTGGGSGASIKIAKGVRFRTGGGGSQNVYGDIEMLNDGEFVVTTKRIVFVAANRAFEEKLSNITAVSVVGDCIAIVTAKDNYSVRVSAPERPCAIIKKCVEVL